MSKSLKTAVFISNLDKYPIDKLRYNLENTSFVKDWAYIVHDKDHGVNPHFHCFLRFKNPIPIDYLSKKFDVLPNFFQGVRSIDGLLNYFTHEKEKDKHQYDPTEVVSNYDWLSEKEQKQSSKNIDEILNAICDGHIRKCELDSYLTNLQQIKNARQISKAFEICYRKRVKEVKDMTKEIIFVTGQSGCGKTSFAKHYATKKKKSYFITGASNDLFQDYQDEEIIIIDDARPSHWDSFSDLLKLTDNKNNTSTKSRYQNKFLMADTLIITTTFQLQDFTPFDEDAKQFRRRISVLVEMSNQLVLLHYYDIQTDRFVFLQQYQNHYLAIKQYARQDEIKEFALHLCKFLS